MSKQGRWVLPGFFVALLVFGGVIGREHTPPPMPTCTQKEMLNPYGPGTYVGCAR